MIRIAILICAMPALLVLLAEEPAKNQGRARFEAQFLEKFSAHHAGGIEMAQNCAGKGQHGELKELCRTMAARQLKEKQQMDAWRLDWYAGKLGASQSALQKMQAEHGQHMQQLNAASGQPYDQLFMQLMVDHHKKGLADAKACQERAEHDELKELCGTMLADQQKEIGLMEAWRSSARSAPAK